MKKSLSKFKLSKYCNIIDGPNRKGALIYHSFLGNGLFISQLINENIREFSSGNSVPNKLIPDSIIEKLKNNRLIVYVNDDEDVYFKPSGTRKMNAIRHLRLNISKSCNMSCSYCYIPNDNGFSFMNYSVAKAAIQKFIKLLHEKSGKGYITFFGGEPLLNWKVLKKSAELINSLNTQFKCITSVSIVTNGTLLTPDIVENLKKMNIKTSISVDGVGKVHDLKRVMKNGDGTYEKIMCNIKIMSKHDYKPSSLVCTLGDHNYKDLSDLILISKEYKIPLTINDAFAEPRKDVYTISEDKIINSVKNAHDFATAHGINLEGTWRWPFDRMLGINWKYQHCAACGGELSVDPEGNLKPCPGFEESYGHIRDIDSALSSEKYHQILNRSVPNLDDCKGCEIEGLCGGGCMVNAYKVNHSNIYKKFESCKLFKQMFQHLVKSLLQSKEL